MEIKISHSHFFSVDIIEIYVNPDRKGFRYFGVDTANTWTVHLPGS